MTRHAKHACHELSRVMAGRRPSKSARPTPRLPCLPWPDSAAKGLYNEGTNRDSVATLQASFWMNFHAPAPHTQPMHARDSCFPCPSTDDSPTTHSSGDTHCSSSLSPSLTVDAGELMSTGGPDLVQDVSVFRPPRQPLTLSLRIIDPSHSSAGQCTIGCP